MRNVSNLQPQRGTKEESYFGSISDLMAALLFIFIITVAVFALRLAEATKRVEETIKEVDEAQVTVMKEIQQRLELNGMQVQVDLDHRVLRIGEDGIYFETGQAAPDDGYVVNVGRLANALADVLPRYVSQASANKPQGPLPTGCVAPLSGPNDQSKAGPKVETVLIEGHTDKRRLTKGRFKYDDNLDLSSARAATILRMLTRCRPDLDELRNTKGLHVLGVSGYAEKRPADETALDPNRRIDLRFIMELPKRPDQSG